MEVPEQDTSISDADVDSELEKQASTTSRTGAYEDEAAADGDTVNHRLRRLRRRGKFDKVPLITTP